MTDDINAIITKAIEAALMDHVERYHGQHSKRFVKPTPQEVSLYAKSIGFPLDGYDFVNFYEAKGWVIGKTPMKDWRAAVRTWKRMDGTCPTPTRKTKLFPIPGKVCSRCKLPAVYKESGGGFDHYYCSDHMPSVVKERFE